MQRYTPAICAALLVCGCTLVSDFSAHQCEVSADCDVLGASIRRCVEHECVPGCENNRHCNAFDPRKPICPATGRACEALTSEDGSCYVSSTYDDAVMGGLVGADQTILGAFAPTLSSSLWLTLSLAVEELNRAAALAGSLLAPTSVVLCRGGDDAAASMDHLVGQLGVKGIVASLDAETLEAVRREPALEGQILLLSPRATDAPLAGDGRWLWYLWPLRGRGHPICGDALTARGCAGTGPATRSACAHRKSDQ